MTTVNKRMITVFFSVCLLLASPAPSEEEVCPSTGCAGMGPGVSLLQLQQEGLQTGTQQRGRILLQTKAHDLLEESASSMASMLAKTHAALSLWLKQTGKIRAKLQAEANGEEKAAAAEDAKLSPEEEECGAMKTSYSVEPGRSWGSLPQDKKGRWRELDCDHNLPATEAPAPEKEAPKNDGAPTQKEEDVPDFSEFIFDQKASSDACSARLFEAKKAKDTLSKEMLDLSDTIEGHVEVQTTETENLRISAQTIEQIKVKNKELREECDKKGLEIDAEADKYAKELEELRQIANPEVRHQEVLREKEPKPEKPEPEKPENEPEPIKEPEEPIVGGEKDEHGCNPSAGEYYCAPLDHCNSGTDFCPEAGGIHMDNNNNDNNNNDNNDNVFVNNDNNNNDAGEDIWDLPNDNDNNDNNNNNNDDDIFDDNDNDNNNNNNNDNNNNNNNNNNNGNANGLLAKKKKKKRAGPTSLIELKSKVSLSSWSENPKASRELSLLSFSREQCLAFVEWQKKKKKKSSSEAAPGDRACDEERKQLQLSFTKAYREITDLAATSRKNTKLARQECLDEVEAQLVNHLAPMLSMRESSTNRLQVASAAIQQLKPLLDNAGVRVERLKEHLESLKLECVEAGDASEQLKTMRMLIYKLEHCPGRNGFQLEVPTV